MRTLKSTTGVSITRIEERASAGEVRDDVLAVEEPLEIRVAGRSVAVVMRTPGHDRELAAGFLVTEGLVRQRDEVIDMVYCGRGGSPTSGAEGSTGGTPVPRGMGVPPMSVAERSDAARENVLDVLLAPNVSVDFGRLSRNVFTSSSCGICSKASIEAVRAQFPAIDPAGRPRVTAEVLAALPEKLRAAQAGFAATGGLHASGLFDAGGTLIVAREDVGRHNALDKVIGHAFFAEQLPLRESVLLVSGRVSFEIVQKALAAGIPCLAAISAPTSAAVELARESGQTLVGFLRPSAGSGQAASTGSGRATSTGSGQAGMRMNVYAGTLAE